MADDIGATYGPDPIATLTATPSARERRPSKPSAPTATGTSSATGKSRRTLARELEMAARQIRRALHPG